MATWVLDTNVLYHACAHGRANPKPEDQPQLFFPALQILAMVSGQHAIGSDSSGRVEKEYATCWAFVAKRGAQFPSYPGAFAFWDFVWKRRRHRNQLPLPGWLHQKMLDANMKPDKDIAFAEAANALDKLLVSQDSDYTEEIRRDLRDAPGVGVQALKYDSALEALSRPVVPNRAGGAR